MAQIHACLAGGRPGGRLDAVFDDVVGEGKTAVR